MKLLRLFAKSKWFPPFILGWFWFIPVEVLIWYTAIQISHILPNPFNYLIFVTGLAEIKHIEVLFNLKFNLGQFNKASSMIEKHGYSDYIISMFSDQKKLCCRLSAWMLKLRYNKI